MGRLTKIIKIKTTWDELHFRMFGNAVLLDLTSRKTSESAQN